jgi:4-carboxymuconolactone decarboxylase
VRTRVPGLEPDEWSEGVRALLEPTLTPVAALEGRQERGRRRPLEILTVMAHNPDLLGAFLPWASALVLQGALSRREHELLALRTAANCGSDFEWAHHVVYARAAGLTDDEIERVAAGRPARGWRDEDAVMVRAADELHTTGTIEDTTWNELARRLTPAALVEVPWVVGQYTMLSMFANATGIDIGPGEEAIPSSRIPPA